MSVSITLPRQTWRGQPSLVRKPRAAHICHSSESALFRDEHAFSLPDTCGNFNIAVLDFPEDLNPEETGMGKTLLHC